MASSKPSQDAIELLMKDHRQVRRLHDEYRKRADAERVAVLEDLCSLLSAHTQLEEELFYPAVQSAIAHPQLVEEARVEHDLVKQLLSKLQSGMLDRGAREASFEVLMELVGRHLDEEEGRLFPEIRRTGLDLVALARKLHAGRAKLRDLPALTRGQHAQARSSAEHVG